MPLDSPRLDDRGYDDLVAELLARIPAHTPEWTHPAPGDPGVTLIELFAWLADTILYRANLVPPRQRRVFLKLLGLPMRAARAAEGLVAVKFGSPVRTEPVTLATGARVLGPPDFETRDELTVLPVEGLALIKRRLTKAEQRALAKLVDELAGLYEIDKPEPYVTTPAFPQGARAEGVDLPVESVDGSLWIALLATKPDPAHVAAVRAALQPDATSGRNRLLSVGVVPATRLPDPLDRDPAPRAVAHRWEVSAAATADDPYVTLVSVADGTAGLARAGVVRLSLPGAAIMAPTNDVTADLRAGVGDAPPRLDDPERAARLVGWLRLRPTEPLQTLPIAWVGVNAVTIDQRTTRAGLIVGVGDGRADQVVQLPATSVDPASLAVEVEVDGAGLFRPFVQLDDIAAAGRDTPAYVLDPEAGRISFGDGVRGVVPPAGARIRVARMRAGGGAAGNLPAGLLKAITAVDIAGASVSGLTIEQPVPTRGGADAEALADAEKRIPAYLRHHDRAVTARDFEALARETPGVRVSRVELLPRFKPQQRRGDVPGVVSVMVLPHREGHDAPAPRPDRPFLEAVHAWLDDRRLVGTELYTIGCEYVGIGLSVAVEIGNGHPREATLDAVGEALRRHLWPLAPGGEGEGWPLGGAVRVERLETVVARVAGVAAVRGLKLFTADDTRWRRVTGSSLALLAWQLPELLTVVTVAVEAGAPGDAPDTLRERHDPRRGGVAIPVVPEVC